MANSNVSLVTAGAASARFLILFTGLVFAITYAGRLVVLWFVTGQAPWLLSFPLFAQMVANGAVAAILFALSWKKRGANVGAVEISLWLAAAGACLLSLELSLTYDVWLGRWDWVTASGAAMLILYVIWVVLRRQEARIRISRLA